MLLRRYSGAFIVCPSCKGTKIKIEVNNLKIVSFENGKKVSETSKIVEGSRKTVCQSCGFGEKELKSPI